jgi:hypothetical protein
MLAVLLKHWNQNMAGIAPSREEYRTHTATRSLHSASHPQTVLLEGLRSLTIPTRFKFGGAWYRHSKWNQSCDR